MFDLYVTNGMNKFRILSLVFIFLIRLRFPKDCSLHDVIKRRYGNDCSRNLRKLQKTDLKLRKAKLDLKFLNDCFELGLLPKFLNFKLANPRLRKSAAYIRSQRSLLQAEIREKRRRINILSTEFEQVKSALRQTLSLLDFTHVSTISLLHNDCMLAKDSEVHQKKLRNLQKSASKNELDPNKVVHNLSSTVLTEPQLKVLSRGLQFALPPKLNYADYLCPFERLFRTTVKDFPTFYTGDTTLLKTRLKEAALSSFHSFKGQPPATNITPAERQALKELRSNKSIIIHKADKGNAVVVIDRSDYIQKMNTIIGDHSKFRPAVIKNGKTIFHAIRSLEDRIIDFLRMLLKKELISDVDYSKLYPSGTKPAILYGLSKVHKNGAPMRPIMSAVNTPAYGLAQFLVPILRPLTTNEFTVRDSFHFAKEISGIPCENKVMASLDVESLFTNIPLDETIQICVENLPDDSPFDSTAAKKALNLCTKEGIFLFNGNYYNQCDGVAMGSPLGPTLANAFLSHFEPKWLAECPEQFKPQYYRRYVDDIFVLFDSQDQLPLFLDYMNTRHKSMRFTSELESNEQFSFLDILVTKKNGEFCTSVYRKPTFSGLYTKFDSFIPDLFKFGLVYSLLHRVYCISSAWNTVDVEIKKLKDIFLKNGYPKGFLDVIVTKFLDRTVNPKRPITTVPKRPLLLVLPYTGTLSLQIRNKLLTAYRCLPQFQLRIIFTSNNRLSSSFPFKDKIPFTLRSGVVYKFTCATCNSCYYGQTKRHLHTRISEHKGISPSTGNKLQNVNSTIHEHCMKCDQNVNDISENNFMILCSAKHSSDLEIKESLLILNDKPNLNVQGKVAFKQLMVF